MQNGKVAIKVFSDPDIMRAMKDSHDEMINNNRIRHPRVMRLQAVIEHRDMFMHIYPLAEGCLRNLLTEESPSKEFSESYYWQEFQGLLSALNYIHTGSGQGFGYHFDMSKYDEIWSYPV